MIIDFHTHVFPAFLRDKRPGSFPEEKAYQSLYTTPNARVVGISDLLRNMDEEGIDRSVIFGFPWEKAERFQRHNDYILNAVHRHPDRLIGFCSFSPLSSQGPAEAERCLQSGLSGVGELALYNAGLSTRVARALKDVMALCSQCNAPLLLHTNEPVGHYYTGKTTMTLGQIYRFLKTYSSTKIVLAHWGGGLLFYGLMKKEVREVLKNVWFDTAASPFLYIPAVYRIAGEILGYEKILFGSDYPLLKPKRYFDEMASENLSPHHTRQIIGLNAAQLLDLHD